MSIDITITDMFCGAGGSTTGAVLAGANVRLAMNHWARAIETHNTNYPNVDHALADISLADPRRYPRTDILIASPECVNHSLAKGKKRKGQGQIHGSWVPMAPPDPSEERSRCTMWDPLRFAEQHGYQAVVLENVVDARYWVMWDAWLHAWQCLGYRWEMVYFNSMFAHPTPQRRDRMYCIFWKEGNRKPSLQICPLAHCPRCEQDINTVQCWKNPAQPWGKYGQRHQYLYHCPACNTAVTPYHYPAASAIDWALPIQRIGDRKKPLEKKTLDRIQTGLQKFMAAPFTVQVNKTSDRIRQLLTEPFPTQTADNGLALVRPFLLDHLAEYRIRDINGPISTICASGHHHSLVTPPTWLVSYYNTGTLTAVESEPVGTVTTHDRHGLLIGPDGSPSRIDINNCGFRMLDPREIQAAMAFPVEYVVTGTKKEQVKQLGNAVTPPVMKLLVERVMASLAG